MPDCDVCGKSAKGVASSALGPISFAYCQDCLTNHREPYMALVGGLSGVRNLQDLRDSVRRIVTDSLAFTSNTEDELLRDIKDNDEAYWKYLEEHARNGA